MFGAALVTASAVARSIDVAAARHLAEQAVEVACDTGDDRLLIAALARLCNARYHAGEPQTGQPFGQESVERARCLGDDVLLAESLLMYLMTLGPARSLQLAGKAIACTGRSGDQLIKSVLHISAGFAALGVEDIVAARGHLEAASQAGQAIGYDDPGITANLGRVQRSEGNPDSARSTLEAALRISRRNGDNWAPVYAILGLACLAGDAGDWAGLACSTASPKRSSTGRAIGGKSSTRATAGTG